jgi:hypothetical protein
LISIKKVKLILKYFYSGRANMRKKARQSKKEKEDVRLMEGLP